MIGKMKQSKPLDEVAFSVLDLAIIKEQHDAADAFERSLDLAKHTEKWGYKRFWLY